MKLIVAAALTVAALAQEVIQSAPFNLVTVSDNYAINGLKLNACHSGAAIESLCTYNSTTASQYYFNYTIYEGNTAPVPTGGQPGLLGYNLPADPPIISSMHLTSDPTSNVGIPVLFPGNETVTFVAFDQNNYLNIEGYVDDTVTPPNANGPVKSYYRWYICETYFGSYTYQTLAWTYGNQPPQNPSCVKTDVKRVFVY